jgi:hypothetical protein
MRQASNNLVKVVPGVIAELNPAIFQMSATDDFSTIELGAWRKNKEGKLVQLRAGEGDEVNPEDIMQGEDVVVALVEAMKGTNVAIS